MLSNIRVRMKLSDFINTDNEKEIMEMINKTHSDLSTTILLHLWYENDEISSTDLKDFLLRWENILHFRTIVKNNSNVEQSKLGEGKTYYTKEWKLKNKINTQPKDYMKYYNLINGFFNRHQGLVLFLMLVVIYLDCSFRH